MLTVLSTKPVNLLIVAMISARTVNLSYLACERAFFLNSHNSYYVIS